jgi:ABC-2 type transport system ATP-binding protein
MLLEVKDLTVFFGRRAAVDRVSLRLDAGEIVGLIGPNGAGKSTLLSAIAGAIPRDGGRVMVGGADADADPLGARRQIGLCDQPPLLYEFLSAGEHVAFVAEARGGAASAELLDGLGLRPVEDRLVRELSFGFRQRVGLAAALCGGTRVVLLDETLNGLDPHAMRAARQMLTQAAKNGAAVMLSTHILGVAEQLCTRLLFMNEGKIVREAAPDAGALESLYLSLFPPEQA